MQGSRMKNSDQGVGSVLNKDLGSCIHFDLKRGRSELWRLCEIWALCEKAFFLLVTMTVCLGWFVAAPAAEGEDALQVKTGKVFDERFSIDFRALSYGALQEPSNSTQNPGNNFLKIRRHVGNLELRPDIRFSTDPLDLMAKPRMRFGNSDLTGTGAHGRGSEWDDEWYVNEWLARLKVREDLFVSYGRENLQWGPSFLFSPSNPFFLDNGRRNPYLEVPGSDFARLVWIPRSSWTISFIANTAEGRNEPFGDGPFEKIYAAKIDYTGRENYGSLILSHKEHVGDTLGFLGGWTVSDALLLYLEGAVSVDDRALYPVEDRSPFGASMMQSHGDGDEWKPVVLLGAAYTFESRGTLTLEYAYNDQGYSEEQAARYYALRRSGAEALGRGGPISGPAQMTLGRTASTGLRFQRRNYALLQYTQTNIQNLLDLTLRWTQNLDDGSCQFTALVTCFLADHLELFSVGTVNGGSEEAEFRSILDYQWMVGIKYTF